MALGWALAAAHPLERPKVSALLSALLEALPVQMLALLGAPVSLAVLLAQIVVLQTPLSALLVLLSALLAPLAALPTLLLAFQTLPAQAQALLPAQKAQGFRERFLLEHSAVLVEALLLLLFLKLLTCPELVFQASLSAAALLFFQKSLELFQAPLPAAKLLLFRKAAELFQAPPFASKPALA